MSSMVTVLNFTELTSALSRWVLTVSDEEESLMSVIFLRVSLLISRELSLIVSPTTEIKCSDPIGSMSKFWIRESFITAAFDLKSNAPCLNTVFVYSSPIVTVEQTRDDLETTMIPAATSMLLMVSPSRLTESCSTFQS